MIATGLHQEPHPEVTFYWRLRDHAGYMRKLGVPFKRTVTRMSRDFVVECGSREDAAAAERILRSVAAGDGTPLFDVDNRGSDVFAMLTWPHDIGDDFVYSADGRRYSGLRGDVAFVAIKNGQHNGIGYFIDTGNAAQEGRRFPLKELPRHICAAFDVAWEAAVPAATVAHERTAFG
jgi:hypothetical protein